MLFFFYSLPLASCVSLNPSMPQFLHFEKEKRCPFYFMAHVQTKCAVDMRMPSGLLNNRHSHSISRTTTK